MPLPQYNPSLVVLAGRSGSGKSAVLQHLAQQGYPVIDLEKEANHSGSAFGHLPFDGTAANSMGFLKTLKKKLDAYKYEPLIFTECKGTALGHALLPEAFLERLRTGFIVYFDVPLETRVAHLAEVYKAVTPEAFIQASQRLNGKVVDDDLKQVQIFLKTHAYKDAIRLLLRYYDDSQAYNYFIRHAHVTIAVNEIDPPLMVEKLTEALMEQHPLFLHCG